MCINCIRNQVDITEGLSKQLTIHFCRACGRYLQPPNNWVACELESKELLTLCIKKVKGLNKVKLIDASFIWTEPHSRRIKLKLTIQKEVFASTILQQSFVIEFIVHNQQCLQCTKLQTNSDASWVAVVQLRQKVEHKRTFFFLEQLILKHSAHTNTTNIKEMPEGVDFFFQHRSHALKFIDFLQSVIPVRFKTSEKLISSDEKSNTHNYKYTFSVEIAPICREDLVCLPSGLANSYGNISPLLLCHKVSSIIHLIDPLTLNACEIIPNTYWKYNFKALSSAKQLQPYVVLDVTPLGKTNGKFVLADVQVAKESDFGKADIYYYARTHLGHILKPGDSALGYDVANSNFNDREIDHLQRFSRRDLPDLILVKKAYPSRRRTHKKRHWKLQDLPKEQENIKKSDQARANSDYEQFLQDIEEEPDLRAQINLYKTKDAAEIKQNVEMKDDDDGEGGEEDDFPEIELEDLLDELTLEDE